MRIRFFNPFVCITGMIALLLLQGCEKEIEQEIGFGAVENSATVKQIDMTVVVPIHPSSLEFFDYSICYTDNTREEYCETVKDSLPNSEIYWVKNFAYKSMPVVCRCEITLIPKVPRDSVVSFSYITPKPYIFSHVIYNSHSYSPTQGSDTDGFNVLRLDDIRIDSFLSAYGSWFCSTCRVKAGYDGISSSFY